MKYWPIQGGACICDDHKTCDHVVFATAADGTLSPLSEEDLEFFNGCLLCGTVPVEGRSCANQGCESDLHPQWPAIYCSTKCALEDAHADQS